MIQWYYQRKPTIVVVGDLVLDRYLWSTPGAISQEAPVLMLDVHEEAQVVGQAGNVINCLHSMGAHVEVISVIGDDSAGQSIQKIFTDRGVNIQSIFVDSERKTSIHSRLIAEKQQLVRFDVTNYHTNINTYQEDEILKALYQLNSCAIDALVISDGNDGVLTPRISQEIMAFASRHAIPVLVDTKKSMVDHYAGATIITPNRQEAQAITGIAIVDDASLDEALQWLKNNLKLTYACITLSGQGMAYYDIETVHIPCQNSQPQDVTAGGDAVLAGLGFALACGRTIEEASHFAQSVAAIITSKVCYRTLSLQEIEAWQKHEKILKSLSKVIPYEDIAQKSMVLKQDQKKIVLVAGCFDLLHGNHVLLLASARELGDVLYIALNSDQSVQLLKGPSRPIISQADRLCVLASLESVDYITIFDGETPYNIVTKLKPDLWVKGEAYNERDKEIIDLIRSYGGEAVTLQSPQTLTTSSIIKKIQNS